jgi:hypothetical protein
MAATQKKNPWFWGTTYADPPSIRICQMAASQGIIMPGAPVETASGYIELSDTDDDVLLGFLVGLVDKTKTWPLTAELAAADEVKVVIARTGDLYGVYCDSADTDSAVVQANVGTSYGMRVSAVSGMVGYCTLDLGEASHDVFNVVDLAFNVEPAKYALADSPGVAICKLVTTLQG